MGRTSRMDLWISDRGRRHWLSHAQPWMAFSVLHHQARCVPWVSSDQSHWSTTPSASLGNRFGRDFLLKKQRIACIKTPQTTPTPCISQRRHLSLHLDLPHRLLLPPRALSILRPVHCPNTQCYLLDLSSHHHSLFDLIGYFGSQMVWHWLRRVVEKWTVLAHLR